MAAVFYIDFNCCRCLHRAAFG